MQVPQNPRPETLEKYHTAEKYRAEGLSLGDACDKASIAVGTYASIRSYYKANPDAKAAEPSITVAHIPPSDRIVIRKTKSIEPQKVIVVITNTRDLSETLKALSS